MNFKKIKKVADDVLERGFTALKIDVDIDAYGFRDLLAEHTAACDNMSRLITAIEEAGHTVTLSDAVYGFGMST